MARAIERIEHDIKMLTEAISAIALELHSAYASYLNLLGQALRKQLILATYHLCTQGYPESFLNLSLHQRQQLQQGIRKLGQQAAQELVSYLEGGNDEEQMDEEDEEVISSASENPEVNSFDSSDPMQLAEWQQDTEEAIQEMIKKLSHDANLLIQKAGILPKKLPEPVLAAAAAASEASAEVIPGPPNLLNLVIEVSNEQDADESSLTQLMAINLRLGEIEFADATLLSGRKQIRNILVQLSKLGREYQKKQQELKVAEAEAAWRASWFED